jgi:hypothetical protein
MGHVGQGLIIMEIRSNGEICIAATPMLSPLLQAPYMDSVRDLA